MHSVAKIWIERNGVKDIEIAESLLSRGIVARWPLI